MSDPWSQLSFETRAQNVDATKVHLLAIDGASEISLPYRYELVFEYAEDGGLAPDVIDDLLRKPCTARWGPTGDIVIHGLLESIVTESIGDVGRIRYRATLVPRLARLAHAVRSRVFQDVDVAGLVDSILQEHGLHAGDDYELRLSSSYPTFEYLLQHQESDLAFLSRHLEHHGVHFHFVQEPDRERVIIADANRGLTMHSTPFAYRDRHSSGSVWEEGVHTLSRRAQVGAASVLLTDFNWRTPQVMLSNLAPADEITGYQLHQEHAAHYKTPSEGAALARVRAEQIVSERVRYAGTATVFSIAAGHAFSLQHHPLGEYDREYLVVRASLRVRAGNEATLDQELELAEHASPYRPPRRTPKPRIHGFIHGRVDGPAHSTAAPIDEHGRYKVLLPFDLNGQPGGKASRWIRVAQPAAGAGYGVHLPLHLGAEVAIGHLGGDPDRPVIIGSMHNADTPNPVTNSNATQSWIQTQAGVRILFDDDVE